MSKLNSNVVYENNQVRFSKEILEYFESIKTEENKEWIEKYFQILSNPSNFNAEKYNVHHIRPCFTFKDENHRNRKSVLNFANEFTENLIKLSIYNHIMAHYYLWKIYKNIDSKLSLHKMCNNNLKRINIITEKEFEEIAKLKEECSNYNQNDYINRLKANQSERNYYNKNKECCIERSRKYREKNPDYWKSDKVKETNKIYAFKHKEKIGNYKKEWYKNNKHKILEKNKLRYENNKNKKYFDPIRNEICSYNSLVYRKQYYKDKYKHININDCLCTD